MKKVRSKLCPTEIGVIKTFSLSPDDEVGEIAVQCSGCTYYYNNLSELCENWEDYEEPKEYWYVSCDGRVLKATTDDDVYNKEHNSGHVSIGNYFGTKEEAELAVEELKAWKRLKDKGFRFEGWQDLEACDEIERMITNRIIDGENIIGFRMDDYHDCYRDLNICFGGEDA